MSPEEFVDWCISVFGGSYSWQMRMGIILMLSLRTRDWIARFKTLVLKSYPTLYDTPPSLFDLQRIEWYPKEKTV